jgi:SAM-dependent methyltransferase
MVQQTASPVQSQEVTVSDLSRLDPTGRFGGLADVYARHRPGYPDAALDRVIEFAGLSAGSVLVDVGSGTGISSRLFAGRGLKVIGIEPNDDMRRKAEAEPLPDGMPPPEYRAGRAEATGLPDGCAAAVLAAQAFHWFDAAVALREFRRILRPGGAVVLLANERDESDPFTAAFGVVMRTAPDTATVEGPRIKAPEALLHSPIFPGAVRETFPSEQVLDEEGVLGRAFSASYAPKEPAAVEVFTRAMRDVFARFQRGGTVALRYETTVYLAKRPRD